jgi:hypothetical protein
MAGYYVRSGAAGAGTGADWTNAYTTINAALSGKAAGDIFYVAEDHNESTAGAVTWTLPGTNVSPNYVYCVNHAGSVPPVSADLATAGIAATSGANSITINGAVFMYGMNIKAGSAASSASINFQGTSSRNQFYKSCHFTLNNSNASSKINPGNQNPGNYTEWDNCVVKFGSATQGINCNGGAFVWKNTASAVDAGGSAPTNLFQPVANKGGRMECYCVDFSALGSGCQILGDGSSSEEAKWVFRNCKLGASSTRASAGTGAASKGMNAAHFENCDSANTNYNFSFHDYAGDLTTEATIVRTPGASNGTTPFSWKLVTTANASIPTPLECPPLAIWNDTTGSSITVTVEGIWGSGSVPKNDRARGRARETLRAAVRLRQAQAATSRAACGFPRRYRAADRARGGSRRGSRSLWRRRLCASRAAAIRARAMPSDRSA